MSRLLWLLLVVVGWVGCRDTEEFVPDTPFRPFSASVFVRVTDPEGRPVDGASVVLGNRVGQTDRYGILYLPKVQLTADSYASINKSGYFHGSRRFSPAAGKTQYVRVILTPHAEVGLFDGVSGGMVAIDAGTSVIFPPNAIADATGHPYSGPVRLLGYAIQADDRQLSEKMPGDLVGRRQAGALGALGSLGMLAVELVDPSGAPLELRAGYTAQLRMDIPASLQPAAPPSIPMWYFDEEAGIWIEQGEANRDNHAYVAEVSHFTYWNFDAWFPLVKWGAAFVYENGAPADQLTVCLTIQSLGTTKCELTNSEGSVCGMVAAGETLLMEVKDPCGHVVFNQQIGPYMDSAMIGPITLPASMVQPIAVSGLAVNCAGNPVTNGFAFLETGEVPHLVRLDSASGTFTAHIINCAGADVTVRVIDVAALKESLPMTFPSAPVINVGTLTACEQLSELIDIQLPDFPGVHYSYFFPDVYVLDTSTTLRAIDSTGNGQSFFLRTSGTEIGTFPATATEIGIRLPTGSWAYGTGVSVTFTHFGPAGDYVQGIFSGTMMTQSGPAYPFTGHFTVRRN